MSEPRRPGLGRDRDEARRPALRRPAARARAPRPDPARPAAAPAAARTCSAGRSSSAATGSTCASWRRSGRGPGTSPAPPSAIALVTPDPSDGRRAAVDHVRPRPGGREHDAGRLGARDRQRPGDRLRATTWRARLLGYPDDQHCEYLLSFGYPADPSDLTRRRRAGGRRAARRDGPRRALVGDPRLAYCQRNLRDGDREADDQPAEQDRGADATAARTARRRPSPGGARRRGRSAG